MQRMGAASNTDDGGTRWGGLTRALFLAFVLAWSMCFLLCVRVIAGDTAFPPVFIEAARDGGFPKVIGPRAGGDRGRELEPGDVLLQWGRASLQGASDLELSDVVSRQTPADHIAHVVVERGGVRKTLRVTTGTFSVFWPRLPAAVVFLLTACLLVYRSPNTSLTRNVVAMLMSWAFVFVCTFVGSLALVITAASCR